MQNQGTFQIYPVPQPPAVIDTEHESRVANSEWDRIKKDAFSGCRQCLQLVAQYARTEAE